MLLPPSLPPEILSLVIFLLYLISGSSCSCSPLLSSPLLYSPLPFVIPPHPRGGRRRCSESVAARSFVPPRHYRSYSWDFRVDLHVHAKKNEYRPERREWTFHSKAGSKKTERRQTPPCPHYACKKEIQNALQNSCGGKFYLPVH